MVTLDIPAQSLGSALRQFADQAGLQLVYEAALVQGRESAALSGELTPRDAIEKLLSGTGLEFEFLDERTVALSDPRARKAASPQLRTATDDAAAGEGSVSDAGGEQRLRAYDHLGQPIQLDEVIVTGSYIRRDPGEVGIAPVTVYSSVEIARTGAINMADFVSRITQATPNFNAMTPSLSTPASGRNTVDLHGLGAGTTLILLNGRRMSKAGQGVGGDGVDLSSIPVSATERIEVLASGASAIYGSDAIGGVINIITRSNYDGADVTVQYGNTTDSDVAEGNVQVALGRREEIFGKPYSIFFSGEGYSRNALMARDRPYTALTNYSGSGGIDLAPPVNLNSVAGLLSHIAGGAGSVRTQTAPVGAPLPANTSTVDAIPSGQNGIGLTPASFAADGTPVTNYLAEASRFTTLRPPQERYSGLLTAQLELTDSFALFADGYYSELTLDIEGAPPYATRSATQNFVTVPATNPYNPFGRTVNVSKAFYELGPTLLEQTAHTGHVTLGARGVFGDSRDWRYEIAASADRATLRREGTPSAISFGNNSPGAAAIGSTDPSSALNVFGDGRIGADAAQLALLRSLLGRETYEEVSQVRSLDARLDGALVDLPAGQIKVAIGSEYREESVRFEQISPVATFASLQGDVVPDRYIAAAFLELDVPLLSAAQGVPLVESLRLGAAGRMDRDSVFRDEVFSPQVGFAWQPVRSLVVRASYAEGYKLPTLKSLYEPVVTRPVALIPPLVDPVTGLLVTSYTGTTGGDHDLHPEESETVSAGFIYEPAAIAGLSISVDYGRTRYLNKVVQASPQTLLELLPHRVTRDPITNAVVAIDQRALNLDEVEAEYVDSKLAWALRLGASQLDLQINSTYNLSVEQTSGAVRQELVDNFVNYPRMRTVGQAFWTLGRYTIGGAVTYDSSTVNTVTPTAARPRRVDHAYVFDLQSAYDFDRSGWGGGLLAGVKLTAGVVNLFDTEPPSTNGDGGFYRIDPRQRRYYVAIRKSF